MAGKGSNAKFDPTAKLRRPPNFPKLFNKIGTVTQRWGVPEDVWPLQRDEKQELDEFWKELVDRSADVPLLRSVMAVVSSALFLFSVAMIFAPRFYVTYQSLAERGKNGQGTADRVARSDRATGTGERDVARANGAPWDEPGVIAVGGSRTG